jgi:hypothetical protein
MTLRIAALASFALLLGACSTAPTPVHTFHVDGAFSAEQIEAIVSARDEWAASTAGAASVELVIGGGAGEGEGRILLAANPQCGDSETVWGCTHVYDRSTSRLSSPNWTEDMLIDPKQPASEFRTTVLHELGHHFGILEHAPDAPVPVVMSLHGSPAHLTASDLTLFANAHGLRPVSSVQTSR